MSEDEFFRMLTRWNELGFAPGAAQTYSNTDYALLEMLIARVSGGSLHDYLHGKLLGPLVMANTRIGADQATTAPGHVLFYEPDGEGFRRVFPYRTSPVGGISVTTSLDDLIRWERALRDPTSGVASMLKQLEAGAPPPETGADPGSESYSFGAFRRAYEGLPLEGYHGVGDYTYLVQVAGTQLSVATLCNMYPGMAPHPAATASSAAKVAADTPPPSVGPPVEVPAAELQRYVGEYRTASGKVFDIATAGNGLVVTPRGRAPMRDILPVGGGRFRQDIPGSTLLLTFKADDGDMVMTAWDVTANESAGDDLRRRKTPAWATTATFAQYQGTYVGDDVDATLYVRAEGDRVLISARGRAESATAPESKPDHFGKWDIYMPRCERDASGRVVALVLDATRVKGMRYTKK